jgi:hypothetical protein
MVASRSAALPLSHTAIRQNSNKNTNSCHAFFLALSLFAAVVLVYSSHHAILDIGDTTMPTTTMQHGFDHTTGGGMSALLWQSSQQASSLVASSSSHLIAQLANFKARPSLKSMLLQAANWTMADDEEEGDDVVVVSQQQQQESSPLLLYDRPNKPIIVAYVVTFPHKCEDDAVGTNATAWLLDAIIVLRHSLHLTTARGGNMHSHYDYHLIALVDAKAADKSCSPILYQSGAFTQVVVKEPPVYGEQIVGQKGTVARKTLHRKGTTEFLPLYSHEMTDYPIVVHVDLDVAFVKPLDDVFDAMLYHPESHIGRAARTRLALEPAPQQQPNQPPPRIVPLNIQAALTLDWPQVMPGRKPGVRPGLLIVKPNLHVMALLIDVIRQGDYVDGYGRDNGWGGRGHGGYTGALGLSGLLAYVYETLLFDTYVELNQCRYNHIGIDVLYRANPSFRPNHQKVGQCRNDGDYCEDCMTTPTTQLHTVRFGGKGIGGCPPPWQCIGEGSRSTNGQRQDETNGMMIPEDQVNLQHCLELQGIWHGQRRDFESKLYDLTSAETIRSVGQAGKYLPHVYNGHCHRLGAGGYNKIAASVRTLQRVPDLYK